MPKPTTNITAKLQAAFNLVTGDENGIALFSCFVNGEPSASIVHIVRNGDEYDVVPLFVAITPSMVLTDHEGVKA